MVGSQYLKCLTRYGLDTRVLQDYSSYNIIYYSQRNPNGTADVGKFVDFEGVDRSLIRKVKEIENNYNIEVFHIIWNSTYEMVLMYHSNEKYLDLKGQLKQFMTGECNAFRYNIRKDTYSYDLVKYEVVCGAIVDTEFKD